MQRQTPKGRADLSPSRLMERVGACPGHDPGVRVAATPKHPRKVSSNPPPLPSPSVIPASAAGTQQQPANPPHPSCPDHPTIPSARAIHAEPGPARDEPVLSLSKEPALSPVVGVPLVGTLGQGLARQRPLHGERASQAPETHEWRACPELVEEPALSLPKGSRVEPHPLRHSGVLTRPGPSPHPPPPSRRLRRAGASNPPVLGTTNPCRLRGARFLSIQVEPVVCKSQS